MKRASRMQSCHLDYFACTLVRPMISVAIITLILHGSDPDIHSKTATELSGIQSVTEFSSFVNMVNL